MPEVTAAEVPIERLPLPMLLTRQNLVLAEFAAAKVEVDIVKAELTRRFAESVKQDLKQSVPPKEHGTVSLQLQDGITAKGEVKKTVKWDTPLLLALAQTLPWERVIALFKIEFSMAEAIYKGVAALSPEMQKKIDDARTVIYGEPTIKLEKAA